jgi:heterodisulfide reductase subunit A-like polyferredoxin
LKVHYHVDKATWPVFVGLLKMSDFHPNNLSANMPVSTSPNFRIVIVGGGIAGLSSAIALRAPGREIVVLEASRMNKEVGAAIS